MPMELPETIRPLFVAAGWPAQVTAVEADTVPSDHPAHGLLIAFNGLCVGHCGAGQECAAGDIEFRAKPGLHNEKIIQAMQRKLNTTLVCIGDVHHGHGALFVDSQGACYLMSQVHDAFWLQASTFADAAEGLLLGRNPQMQLL
ncbi:SUKH-3 domain-containing protein [Pseudomonas rubra]|uniref:SUKH-3 domain-containing protein n=1 Tax=Pseudomonas rubra TaxID=2942627 RepID=A0ABT5P9G8_9PSED|nr:SUKH-3 domain-containing protein [Pseudomonas rubra]MDD1014949.1 SUKH-3 domain-containing protein [Pseudomonas rubra]MDD1041304.1 SUKH-3 domain-containing protein [Pseudomonas rubra]MDD1157795.1 SUKH-3 domain-containing protein [Pseudomonas rubra]